MTSVPRGAALASVIALLATLLMAAPVMRAPSQRIFGSGEILGHDDPNRDPLVVIEQLRSGRVSPPYLQPLTDLPGRVIARAVGPVAAYNVMVLSTFPLAAAAAYVLARHLFVSHAAAMVAALAYAFLPFHVVQAGGHPHVAQTHWIALYFLALWRCVDRPRAASAAWLAAASAAVTLSNFYGGWIAAVLSPVALLAYAAAGEKRAGWLRRVAATAGVLCATALFAIVVTRWLAPEATALGFDRADLFVWSARWWSYLVPPAEHPLLGSAVRAFWTARGVAPNAVEHQQVGLTWGLVALATVPLWRWLRGDRESPGLRIAPALAAVAAVALLCSLSPEREIGGISVIRPSALLYTIAPMFRAYARFGVVVGLMTALLAGAGAAWLWSRPRGRVAAAVLLGMAAFELAPFPPWRWREVVTAAATRSARDVPVAPAGASGPVAVARLIGFHAPEHDGKRTWRWMGQTGALALIAPHAVAGVVVDLELRSFPAPRKVDWLLDARPGGTLDVTPEWRTYTIALGDVGPGEHMLTIAVGQPAISADEILHNTDDRRLAVALGRWTIAGPGPSRAPSPP